MFARNFFAYRIRCGFHDPCCDGARIGKPTEDVLISDCTLTGRRFAAIGIGSETSGGVRNVRIEKCKMTSRKFGIYIKTRIGRGGVIENICGDDLEILGGGFLKINLTSAGNLNTADDPVAGLTGFPLGRNFNFSNVRVTDCPRLVDAKDISPQKPLENLTLADITGNCTNGISLANIRGAKLRGIQVTGCPGAFITLTNVQGSGLETFR
jgi:polygalacturonase